MANGNRQTLNQAMLAKTPYTLELVKTVITFSQDNKNIEKGASLFEKGEAEMSLLKPGVNSHLRPPVLHTPGRQMDVRFTKSCMNVA